MKNNRKKNLLSVILSIALIVSVVSCFDFSANASILSSSGSCGENVIYKFNELTGELTISGIGDIYDYSFDDLPFVNRDDIVIVKIDKGITRIGDCAFFGCNNLKRITIPNSVISIGDLAFGECLNLTSVELPDNVITIGNSAFYACKSLINLTIPNNVSSISDMAFFGCENLESISLGYGTEHIGNLVFGECPNIANITVNKDNPYYDSRNNCNAIIDTTTNTFVIGCKNSYIPNDVISIGDFAFNYCVDLLSVEIPPNISSIGDSAFVNCYNLNKLVVDKNNKYYDSRNDCNAIIETATNTLIIGCKNSYIPIDVISIGVEAFNGCTGLISITIPDNVITIGDCAFYNCTELRSVSIGKKVIRIGDSAFYRCNSLKTIYYNGTKEQWNNISIGNYNNCLLNATIQYNYHIHDCIVLDSIEADCINNGLYIYECKDCGETFIEEPKALGHNTITDKAVAPTCTETGLTEGSHCSRCDTIFIKQKIVEPLCHNYIPTVTKPTCTEKGYTTYNCSRCESKYVDNYTNALNHSFTNYISDGNATCLDDGTKTAKCDRCNVTNTVTDVDSKLGHSYVATITKPTCTEGGYTTYKCSRCEDSYVSDYTEALGHTLKVINSVAPTCTETGLSEGSSCSVCGVVLIEQQIISAKGHKYELYRTTATCEKTGYDVYKCSVCSSTKTEKVDSLGHICDSFNGVVDGELSYNCSVCGKEYTQTASEIFEKWDSSIINKSAGECPELDVVNDGIINAKDYAKLKHLQKYNN